MEYTLRSNPWFNIYDENLIRILKRLKRKKDGMSSPTLYLRGDGGGHIFLYISFNLLNFLTFLFRVVFFSVDIFLRKFVFLKTAKLIAPVSVALPTDHSAGPELK